MFLLLVGATPLATAQAPTYQVVEIAPYSVATTVYGASPAGHVVGSQVVLGYSQPFVATLAGGLTQLPLPPGYQSGAAFDANSSGVVVGTVADTGFPFDLGEPAIWTPDGSGGYTVQIPQQFTSLPSPLGGNLAVDGGQCVAVNDLGTIVGWSRYQGFQGGPSTRFSLTGAPVDLRAAGFEATVRDLSENDLIVGGGLRMDLTTGVVTSLGVPPPLQPGNVSFTNVIAYGVNSAGESVVAADLASVPTENYLTYLHSDAVGFTRLYPAQLPSRFVGRYDISERGDVAASGGVLFRDEGILVPDFGAVLAPSSSHWDVGLGIFGDGRWVYTTAFDTVARRSWIVALVPAEQCQVDLGFQGPGSAAATFCGTGLADGQSSLYAVTGAPPGALGALFVSQAGLPDVPVFGGVLASFGPFATAPLSADAFGEVALTIAGFDTPAARLVLQSAFVDPGAAHGFAFTNAVRARFGP